MNRSVVPDPTSDTSAGFDSGDDRWVGRRVGKYRFLRPLGRGGMGAVYAAKDEVLGRQVAIKLVAEEGAGSSIQAVNESTAGRRLLAEAQRAASLNHPNVVTIFDIGRCEGGYFIVMELVAGTSARAAVAEKGPMDWQTATRIIADACRGLSAAHRQGLVHRDLKPDNLLLAADGTTKLADFGVAKGGGGTMLTTTAAGLSVGTPTYMSPEQCRCEEVDERSDIYSLGATYYALLAGAPPYEAETAMQVMFAHCGLPVPDIRLKRPDVPAACATIIHTAMAKVRSDRFDSADAMLATLESLLESAAEPQYAPEPTTAMEPVVPHAIGAASAHASSVESTPWAGGVALAPEPSRRTSTHQFQTPRKRRIPRTAWIAGAVTGGAAAIVLVVYTLLNHGTTPTPTTNGPSVSPPAFSPVAAGDMVFLRLKHSLERHPPGDTTIRLTRDGKRAITAASDGKLRFFDTATGRMLNSLPIHPTAITAIAVSNDGKWLASSDGSQVVLSDAVALQRVTHLDIKGVRILQFAPDGRTLYVVTSGELFAMPVTDGRFSGARFLLKQLYMPVIDVSADGTKLAIGNWDTEPLRVLSTVRGQPIASLATLSDQQPLSVRFSADGASLLVGTQPAHNSGGRAFKWDVGASAAAELAKRPDRVLAVAPLGGRTVLYTAEWDNDVPLRLIDLGRPGERQARTGIVGVVRSIDVAAEAHLLGAAAGGEDGGVKLFDMIPRPANAVRVDGPR